MTKAYIALLLAALLVVATPSRAETLTNQSVLSMTKAGLGMETIVAKIKASATSFDTSTDQLVVLKQQNVPDSVIAAMLNASTGATVSASAAIDSDSPNPHAPHASGMYLLDMAQVPSHMVRMDATHSNQTKSTGFLAYAFTYGIAPVKFKTVLPNATARVRTSNKRPIFYFYFDQANAGLSGNPIVGLWLPGAVTSPNGFSLIRFDVNKSDREAVLGQYNITGIKSGVMDKARVTFSYDDVSPGVFKVSPDADLPVGEYAFVYLVSGAAGIYGGGAGARIYDFSIVE